jgi:ribosome-associated heat shock protein Hsp15
LDSIRIDKWLWAVRLYKTRTQAADACKGGKVKIGDQKIKASREVKVGETVDIQLQHIKKKVKVIKAVKNRVAAKFVPDLLQDLTPEEEYERLEMMHQLNLEKRDRGIGRPTKKDRREISKLKGKK